MLNKRQLFAVKPKPMTEFRRLNTEKPTPLPKILPWMVLAFSFGWVPAAIILFPFMLLFFWSIRKFSGY